MTKNTFRTISKIAYVVAIVVSICLFIWLGASFVEVVTHNLDTDYVYKSWNLLTMLFR